MEHASSHPRQGHSGFDLPLLVRFEGVGGRHEQERVRNVHWVENWETQARDQVNNHHVVEVQVYERNRRQQEKVCEYHREDC